MNTSYDKTIQKQNIWIELLISINLLLETLPFAIPWASYYSHRLAMPYGWKGVCVVIAIFLFIFIAFGRTYSAFKVSVPYTSEIIYSQTLALLFTDISMFLLLFLLTKKVPVLWPMVVIFVIQFLFAFIWAKVAHFVYYKSMVPAKSAMVWDMREPLESLIDQYGMNKRFEVVRSIYVVDCIRNVEKSLTDIDVVFLCGVHSHERNQIIKYCVLNGKKVYVIPRIGDVIMSGAETVQMFHLPMLLLEKYNPSPFYLIVKRIFDVAFSSFSLLILSPLMVIVALIIKRDGGTAFYKQTRLTKNGKEFEVLKFRSMKMNAESDGIARLSAGDNDDRITPIGRIIRKFRIDELPQLINILHGDMSIVGPRPERPEIASIYEKEMPEFKLRLQAKAGLTGRAQVFGKYNTTPYDKLLMDLQYIAGASIAEDLKIIFATVKILFLPESTEGISLSQTTALYNDENR